MKEDVFKHILEVHRPSSRLNEDRIEPDFVYFSERLGALVRGIKGASPKETAIQSVVHPGLFMSVVLRGTAQAGPLNDGVVVEYEDGALIAIAVAATTDWLSVSSEDAELRGIGIAVPQQALARLGLEDSFLGLFDDNRTCAAARAAAGPHLRAVCEEVLRMRAPDELDRVLLDAYAMKVVVEAMRLLKRQRRPVLHPCVRDRLITIRDLIEADPSGGWTVTDLAHRAGLGVRTLSTHFRSEFGQGVMEFVRNARLEDAREALAHRHVSVSEAAFAAGYSNPANFATAFRRRFGCPPRAYTWHADREAVCPKGHHAPARDAATPAQRFFSGAQRQARAETR